MTSSGRAVIAFVLGAGLSAILVVSILRTRSVATEPYPVLKEKAPDAVSSEPMSEGKIREARIIAGPFDLHRKYRSMEGPWTQIYIKVGDLLASGKVELPEGMVSYVEDGGAAPSMAGGGPAAPGTPQGVVQLPPNSRRELFWFKGLKLEVLDENDKVLPTAEFICHFNVDVEPVFRNRVFPNAERCTNTRIVSISQGATKVFMPEGTAIPVASDETWQFSFQAANRTTTERRRIKHIMTAYFVKDSDLWRPITPLHYKVPYIVVVVDRHSPDAELAAKKACPSCVSMSRGVNAPNNVIGGVFDDGSSIVSGHWVVPPGKHTYCTQVAIWEPDFAEKKRKIHAAWTHIHPLCTEFSLVLANSPERPRIFTTRVKTKINPDGGFEIEHIDYLSSKEGIEMPQGGPYELEVTYQNDTGVAHDSMAATGIYFADEMFKRPNWAMFDADTNSCGIDMASSPPADRKELTPLPPFELFDIKRDGPLLTSKRWVELETTAGKVHLVLEPELAPITTTHLFRLFEKKAYVGVEIPRYEEDFIFQVSLAHTKAEGQNPISPEAMALVRRVPIEVQPQLDGKIKHEKYVLSMARDDDHTDSGVSSFSMLIGKAVHLDKGYTIFGHVVADGVTLATFKRMASEWDRVPRPYILDTRVSESPLGP
jgi:cyclophilin family peptidyl-prolyl cis-trans isomerase